MKAIRILSCLIVILAGLLAAPVVNAACTGNTFCTAGCGQTSTNCACQASLCQTYYNVKCEDYPNQCCGGETTGTAPSCYLCSNGVQTFTCPDPPFHVGAPNTCMTICGATPTPTPSCNPDPSCAASTCTGQTCSDACGNTYYGTKCCSTGIANCDNNSCSGNPLQKNCTDNCGNTVKQPCIGTIKARAFQITQSDICPIPTGKPLVGTQHQFSTAPAPSPAPAPQATTDPYYAAFSNIFGGYYVINPQPPNASNWTLTHACWSTSTPSNQGNLATGDSRFRYLSTPKDSETLTWDLGYTPPGPWVQTQGGDVYAAGAITSSIPFGVTPRKFNLDGSGGYPGVVIYGGTYDFDIDLNSNGANNVSSKNWSVKETSPYPISNFYDMFLTKFGGKPATVDYTNPSSPLSKPASKNTPYYVDGDMTTSGDWSIGDGEKIIFFVNGNLTIGGKITLTGPNKSGFVAFIASKNITVASNVGVGPSVSNPVVEGIYMADGVFNTGASSPGAERFVGKGSFIANSFNLNRNLGSDNNINNSAELFIYNPQLLFTMPDAMRDVPYRWEEVAP